MQIFTLIRDYRSEATLGRLIGEDGKEICKTLERPKIYENKENLRDNSQTKINESCCIPEGIYVCKKYSSAKFPDAWEIQDVPSRDSILFHSANYVSQLLGCVAICNQVIDMNPKNDDKMLPEKKWFASQSRDALDRFKNCMPKEFQLKITSINTLCNVGNL